MNYTPEKLVAISRYRNYFPTLSSKIQSDTYARMKELLKEEKKYCDKGAGNCHGTAGFPYYYSTDIYGSV